LAFHAKLDELLKVSREARTELASIDEEEPEDIEKVRDRERQDVDRQKSTEAADSVARIGPALRIRAVEALAEDKEPRCAGRQRVEEGTSAR
jgi:low affinity Fe/Cu permease